MSKPQLPLRPDDGKANAITLGLFGADFVRPTEQSQYEELNATLLQEFAPVGILELALTSEIRRAMWRLRRCGEVEANMVSVYEHSDSMEAFDKLIEYTQKSVDRARSQSHRLLHKCTAELRRLQTERQFRQQASPEPEVKAIGLADSRVIAREINALHKVGRTENSFAKRTHLDVMEMGRMAERSQFAMPLIPQAA